MEALSFYEYEKFLDRPNHFGRVPIILDGSNSFWLGPNNFGSDPNNLHLTKRISTLPKQIFGPIEGQGISKEKAKNMSFVKSVNISKSFLSHIGKSKRFYQLKFLYQRIPFFTCFLYQESTVHTCFIS